MGDDSNLPPMKRMPG
jgi:hypothetical protein